MSPVEVGLALAGPVALWVGGLLPLLLPADVSPSPQPTFPEHGAGFAAATVLGGFFGVGLLVLLWVLLNLKPKRREPYSGPND